MEYYEGREHIMGTVFRLHAFHEQGRGQWMRDLADSLFDMLQEDDERLSIFKTGSIVNRINAAAGDKPVPVDEDTFELFVAARRWWDFTGGLFDITIGAMMRSFGYYRNAPLPPGEPPPAEKLPELTGCDKIELDAQRKTVRLTKQGMMADLGGFAKGWVVQRRGDILRRAGLSNFVISAGTSTVMAVGAPPGEDGWPTELEDYGAAQLELDSLVLKDESVSVSANYRNTRSGPGGITIRHIMNPRTFEPVQQVRRVVVVGPRADDGEALSTALLIQGAAEGVFSMATRPEIMVHFDFPTDG
jgi:FAD:protein FMN transferase